MGDRALAGPASRGADGAGGRRQFRVASPDQRFGKRKQQPLQRASGAATGSRGGKRNAGSEQCHATHRYAAQHGGDGFDAVADAPRRGAGPTHPEGGNPGAAGGAPTSACPAHAQSRVPRGTAGAAARDPRAGIGQSRQVGTKDATARRDDSGTVAGTSHTCASHRSSAAAP